MWGERHGCSTTGLWSQPWQCLGSTILNWCALLTPKERELFSKVQNWQQVQVHESPPVNTNLNVKPLHIVLDVWKLNAAVLHDWMQVMFRCQALWIHYIGGRGSQTRSIWPRHSLWTGLTLTLNRLWRASLQNSTLWQSWSMRPQRPSTERYQVHRWNPGVKSLGCSLLQWRDHSTVKMSSFFLFMDTFRKPLTRPEENTNVNVVLVNSLLVPRHSHPPPTSSD